MRLKDRGIIRDDEQNIINAVLEVLEMKGITSTWIRRQIFIRFRLPNRRSFLMFRDVDKWYPFGDLTSGMTTTHRVSRDTTKPLSKEEFIKSNELISFLSIIEWQYRQ